MTVTITPELERMVNQRLARGDYASLEALVQDAVQRLIEEERGEEELRHAIQTGLDQIERGEYSEYDERTIQDLAREVHDRGSRRLAELKKPVSS